MPRNSTLKADVYLNNSEMNNSPLISGLLFLICLVRNYDIFITMRMPQPVGKPHQLCFYICGFNISIIFIQNVIFVYKLPFLLGPTELVKVVARVGIDQ